MAKLFFRLRSVPEDEADEVKQLLDDHSIPWFETSAGRWGASFPAIWLSDNRDLRRARELVDAYQTVRVQKLREEDAERQRQGVKITIFTQFQQQPLRVVLAMSIIAIVVYFSVSPFLSMFKAQ